ncbi:hypothetical protein MAPG_03759 [Magnaporthiopsis poae ATCC 64411]|uniref:Uncharacterized protein n=1 Tax=Magnaporthiopsis poae (strain ATCC 64411 / 73-15) TaxID=644358 RepID=A0A0C4DUW4_MAGP6|nr:hypothetical protein MAPG_03759 [Magnaporthiopsis poae ATCC 64411]
MAGLVQHRSMPINTGTGNERRAQLKNDMFDPHADFPVVPFHTPSKLVSFLPRHTAASGIVAEGLRLAGDDRACAAAEAGVHGPPVSVHAPGSARSPPGPSGPWRTDLSLPSHLCAAVAVPGYKNPGTQSRGGVITTYRERIYKWEPGS